jgi:tRNA threonylcarbamoyladenosine biosynthesis protein TsaE
VTKRELDLPTRRATTALAKRLAPLLGPSDLVILSGDLGAGKTFFVRALCRALGVPPAIDITSPTFTLVHELSGTLPIVHADAYRLRNASDVASLGLREARSDGRLLLVEWGEPYIDVLGGDAVVLGLEHSGASGRRASLAGDGPRSEPIVIRVLS